MADSWLETELARELRPVSAPDSLWARIHEQRRPLRVRPPCWTAWSIAAASLLMLLAGLVWRLGAAREPAPDLEALAAQELRDVANGSAGFDIRSGDPEGIRRWAKANLGIDIPLKDYPVPGNEAVTLLGAKFVRLGRYSAGVVAWRVGPDFAAMLVPESRAGAAVPVRPCLLCHAVTPALMVLK